MFITYSGRGHFTPIIIVGIFALGLWLIPDDYMQMSIPLLFLLSGIIIWTLGLFWNKEKLVYDKETETTYKEVNIHKIFFLPMQYWGLLCFVFGIGIAYQIDPTHAIIYTIATILLVIASIFILKKKTVPNNYTTRKK